MNWLIIPRDAVFRRRSSGVCGVITLLSVMCIGGCTQFKETYYQGVFDPPAKGGGPGPTSQPSLPLATQFYRYKIEGNAFLSATRFESGLFDAHAVDTLFGEVKAPPIVTSKDSTGGQSITPATVKDIPAFEAEHQYVDSKDSLQVNAQNASVAFDMAPAQLDLKSLASVQARKVVLKLKLAEKGKVDPTAKGFTIQFSSIQAIEQAVPSDGIAFDHASVNGDISCSDAQSGQSGGLSLRVSGGVINLESSGLTKDSGLWTGTSTFAVTESPYHRISWQGGTFLLGQAGVVNKGPLTLQTTGGFASFKGVTQLRAEKGGTLRITMGKISGAGANPSTIEITEFKASNAGVQPLEQSQVKNTEIALNQWSLDGKSLDKLIQPQVEKDQSTGDRTFELGGGRLTNSSTFNVTGADGQAQRIDITAISGTKLAFDKTGIVRVTADQAVASAVSTGKTVVIGEPALNRHIFARFGPEGQNAAQSDQSRLVIFMSSNPRALTDRIKATANSAQMQQVIATAIARPRQLEQEQDVQEAAGDISMALSAAQQALKELTPTTNKSGTDKPADSSEKPPSPEAVLTALRGTLGTGN